MKTFKKQIAQLSLLVLIISLLVMACQKQAIQTNNSTNPKQLSVYLTDDPCQFDSVLIDIRYVEVKIDTTNHMNDDNYGDDDKDSSNDHKHRDQYGKWDTLSLSPGVYNILQLRNGVDTLLGSANLPAGKIRKIRVTLGTNNSLVYAGVTYPLNLLQGTSNYVYIKIHSEDEDEVAEGKSAIRIDFNVCESIVSFGGQYYLRPLLKPFSMRQFGRIEGNVYPHDARPFVSVFNATDSATAIPEEEGEYKVFGIREGVYSITFKGSNGYMDTTLTNVQILKGVETHIPDITLRK